MEQQPAAVAATSIRARAARALRRRHNWEQLAKFCVVGASGYVVNLGVYALLLNWANLDYRIGAAGSLPFPGPDKYRRCPSSGLPPPPRHQRPPALAVPTRSRVRSRARP